MNEWLFTFVLVLFPSPDDAKVTDGYALVVANEAKCEELRALVKKRYEGVGLVLTTCDPLKAGAFIDRKRGNLI